MYENIFKDVQASFRPVMDMVEINQKAAEKMFALQSDYMNSLVNTTLSQIQELTVATDPQQFLDLQVKFFKRMEDQFSEVAEQELATINEASGELTDIVKTNLDNITQTELQYMDEVGKLLTMTGLPDFTAAGAAPAANTATAPATAPVTKAAPRTVPKKAAAKPAAKKPAAKKAAPKTAAKPAKKPAVKTTATPAKTTAVAPQPTVKVAEADKTAPATPVAKTTAASSAKVETPKQPATKL